jgi:hypothetical protein
MNTKTGKYEMAVLGSSFIAVVFLLVGLTLLEAWLFVVGGRFLHHAFALAFGLVLLFMAVRRVAGKLHGLRVDDTASAGRRPRFDAAGLAGPALLTSVGILLGLLIINGGLFPLAIAVSILVFAPWSRISFCRHHFITACMSVWMGTVAVLAIGHNAIDLMFPPIACWVLWAYACCALIWRAEKLWHAERKGICGVAMARAVPGNES